jgi:hypothetical protein
MVANQALELEMEKAAGRLGKVNPAPCGNAVVVDDLYAGSVRTPVTSKETAGRGWRLTGGGGGGGDRIRHHH